MNTASSPADAAGHAARLEKLRTRLRQEIRDTLLRVDADRYAMLAQQVHDTKDHAVIRSLVETGNADIARDAAELADADAALARLAAGRYGQCTDCGTRIPEARLEAYPTAKRCQPCQARHEQQGR